MILRVRVRFGFEQQLHHRRVAIECRISERHATLSAVVVATVCGFFIRASIEEQLHNLLVPFMRRVEQRRFATRSPRSTPMPVREKLTDVSSLTVAGRVEQQL